MFYKKSNFRQPNTIEFEIIEILNKRTRSSNRELFFLFLILDLGIWASIFLFFSENWFLGILMIFLGIVVSLLLFGFRETIKETNVQNSHLVCKDEGEWKIEIKGTSKTQHFVSMINDKKIAMIIPTMSTPPEYGKPKNIMYEYVQLLESEPTFGYNFYFISINENGLEKKHLTYLKNLKSIGLFSIISCCCFIVFLILAVGSDFSMNFAIYGCIILLFPFLRTIYAWIHNKKLKKELLKH